MSSKKFCILLTGQLRGDIGNVGRIARLGRSFGATTVLSSWEFSGTKIEGALGYWQFLRLFGRTAAACIPVSLHNQHFYEVVPGLKAALVRAAKRRVTPEEILDADSSITVDIESELMDLRESMPGEENTLSLYYKIWRANRIKRGLERQQCSAFDGVLRIRADLQVHNSLGHFMEQSSVDNSYYLDTVWRQGDTITGVGDGACYTSSTGMDYYSSIFHRVIEKYPHNWRGTHKELLDHLQKKSVSISSFPCIAGQSEIEGWFNLRSFLEETNSCEQTQASLTLNLALTVVDTISISEFECIPVEAGPLNNCDVAGIAFAVSLFADKINHHELAVISAGLASAQVGLADIHDVSFRYLKERLQEACARFVTQFGCEVQSSCLKRFTTDWQGNRIIGPVFYQQITKFGSVDALIDNIIERIAQVKL